MPPSQKPTPETPEALPTVPLRDVVVFPHMMMTFVIGLFFVPETKDRDIFTYKG